jgi:hypothetical protein
MTFVTHDGPFAYNRAEDRIPPVGALPKKILVNRMTAVEPVSPQNDAVHLSLVARQED